MNLHPLAKTLPPMSDEDYAALKASIKASGVREPTVWIDGMILEGRHRERACEELELVCPRRQYDYKTDGESLVAFVADRHTRRNLTPAQRAAWAAELVPFYEQDRHPGQPKKVLPPAGGNTFTPGTAAAAAAKSAGSTERSTERAKRIKEADPQVHESVKAGEISLAEAERVVVAKKHPPPPPASPLPPTPLEVAVAIAPKLKDLVLRLQAIRREVVELAGTSDGRELRSQQIELDINNAVSAIKFAVPAHDCPKWSRKKPCDQSCKVCKGAGWITDELKKRLPRELPAQ
jgi:ParB-like chromosome segregation protein Spo0J